MNALDALFSRQVPTRSAGAPANAANRDRDAGRSESFATALKSGRPDKPEPRARSADDKAPSRDGAVNDVPEAAASEAAETDQADEAEDSQALNLLALLARRAEKNEDETGEDDGDEIVIEVAEPDADEQILAADEESLVPAPKVAPHENNGVDGKAVAAAAIAEGNPRATITAQQDKPLKGEAGKGEASSQAASVKGAAYGASAAEAMMAGGGKADDADANSGKGGQSGNETDMAALDPDFRTRSTSVRGEGDVAMDKVEVLEKRSVNGPAMSQNGDNVARAVLREAAGMNPQQSAEPAETSALRATAASERANAAFMARPTGQTLHTLRIQLNPEALGQVTAVMRLTDGELKVDLKVQSAEAYRQLSDDSSSIAKALRAHGYGVDQITVQHAGNAPDRGGMNAQQGQTSSQQFQFRDGLAQNAGGGNGNGGGRREQAGGNGSNHGELSHEAVSGTAGSSRHSDGMYL
ncbi:MAG: hypothetical protein CML29_09950 [Rhizobiales bacterium]|nr:hypothetical protein [Hyphomicrobiales bacterium]